MKPDPAMVARLVREWGKHRRLIIAVDFDDTVYPYRVEDPSGYGRRIALLRMCQGLGARVVVWTASNPDRYPMIREYLEERGLRVDAVNENAPGLPFGNWGKIYANIYLDDRGGLAEAEATLEAAYHIHLADTNTHG